MKLLVVVCLLAANFAFAGNMKVQNGKMTVDLNSEPLSSVIENLKQQTGMKVSVETNADSQNVSASFVNLPVAAGIKKILEGTGINYVVVADEGGEPTALFIGSSLNPDASARPNPAVNNMPNRGVVTPVAPLPAPAPDIRMSQPPGARPGLKKNATPAVTIPTGGGFVPNNPSVKPQQTAPSDRQIPPEEEQQAVEDDEQDQNEQ